MTPDSRWRMAWHASPSARAGQDSGRPRTPIEPLLPAPQPNRYTDWDEPWRGTKWHNEILDRSIHVISATKTSGRTVTAPSPSGATANLPPNRVLSVTLGEGEEVEWLWTTTADGTRYVSGYRILPTTPDQTQSLGEH